MKKMVWIICAACMFSCNEQQGQQDTTEYKQEENYQAGNTGSGYYADTTGTQQPGAPLAPPLAASIIRHASLRIKVDDFSKTNSQLKTLIKGYDAWIASDNLHQSDYEKSSSLTIKVPSQNLDALMQALGQMGGTIEQQQMTAEDVSVRIVDSKGRSEAKRLIRARYLELLKQAGSMSEMLEVQREISRITEEIEVADYTVKNLEAQVRYSTIDLQVYQPLAGAGDAGFLRRSWDALGSGASLTAELFLSMLRIWPVLLMLVTGIYWLRRRMKRSAVAAR